jgi:hypothetical protein
MFDESSEAGNTAIGSTRQCVQRGTPTCVDSRRKDFFRLSSAAVPIPPLPARRPTGLRRLAGVWTLGLASAAALAAPYTPTSDDQVLVQLPAQSDRRSQEAATLRRQLAAEPERADLAAELAWIHLRQLLTDGDPRFAGYAQAALQRWWVAPEPPPEVLLPRAVLRQFQHQFDPALADLGQLVREEPDNAQAWAWVAAIEMVQAHYDLARRACEQGAPHMPELQAVACTATVDSATGQAHRAVDTLRAALAAHARAHPGADAGLRLWVQTRLAEALERLGDWPAAEQAYRAGLALGVEDSYLLAAYADFLLDRGRAADVLVLLKDRERNDLHLLRLALAGHAAAHARAGEWTAMLAARFDAARLRGDTAHQKEESRFALQLKADPTRALPLAQANFAVQREAADARILLEAALAARNKAAATPVLDWLRASRFESPVLAALASRVSALP